jgi:hypothetical protein
MGLAVRSGQGPEVLAMKALCWHGQKDIRYETVPDPRIEQPRDALVQRPSATSSTAASRSS